MEHLIRALLIAFALVLATAAPASAMSNTQSWTLVAYGQGLPTTCEVTVTKDDWFGSEGYMYEGRTECNVAIQQSGQARLGSEVSGLCSGFRTWCYSGDTTGDDHPEPTVYTVELIAPHGQGWLASPQDCQGPGSDRITCTFSVNAIKW